VIISHQALSSLGLSLGDSLWISFKATAVTLL
jgi:tungstate transport system ATP-binding protein